MGLRVSVCSISCTFIALGRAGMLDTSKILLGLNNIKMTFIKFCLLAVYVELVQSGDQNSGFWSQSPVHLACSEWKASTDYTWEVPRGEQWGVKAGGKLRAPALTTMALKLGSDTCWV